MPRIDAEEPLCSALLDVVQAIRGLASRTQGVCGMAAEVGRPMDPIIVRARKMISHLEAAAEQQDRCRLRNRGAGIDADRCRVCCAINAVVKGVG